MLRHRRCTGSTLVMLLLLTQGLTAGAFLSTSALAKGKAKAHQKAPAAADPELEKLKKELEGDEDSRVTALDSIGESGTPEAVPLVKDVLDRGSTPKVLQAALKAAAKLKDQTLSSEIAPYVQDRSEEVRRAAVSALLKTRGPIAVEALRKGLHSNDAAVRGTSATGLGALGAHEALDDLFTAFDHGIAEAAAAIGQICHPEECEKFADRTGHVAFDVMSTGFDQILFRPSNEIPDEEKSRLIGRLRELGTPEVGKYLADVSDRWPKDWSKKLKQMLDSAVHAVGGVKK